MFGGIREDIRLAMERQLDKELNGAVCIEEETNPNSFNCYARLCTDCLGCCDMEPHCQETHSIAGLNVLGAVCILKERDKKPWWWRKWW